MTMKFLCVCNRKTFRVVIEKAPMGVIRCLCKLMKLIKRGDAMSLTETEKAFFRCNNTLFHIVTSRNAKLSEKRKALVTRGTIVVPAAIRVFAGGVEGLAFFSDKVQH